jgi:hypothetical protein
MFHTAKPKQIMNAKNGTSIKKVKQNNLAQPFSKVECIHGRVV